MTHTFDLRRMAAAILGASLALALHACDRGGEPAHAQTAPPCEGYVLAVGSVTASLHEWNDPTGWTSTQVGEFSFQMRRASPWWHYVSEHHNKPVKVLLVPNEPRALQQVIR